MKVNTFVDVDLILLLGKEGLGSRELMRRFWDYVAVRNDRI
jgi:hypothetical protein